MLSAGDFVLILAAYTLGCFSTGYYLVRLRTGTDIRRGGSGSAGATNVGRTLGRSGFAATFAVDIAKGAVAVALAAWLGSGRWVPAVAAAAVVAGHIWPAQLGFRGGKGAATAFGAALVLDPLSALGALAVAGAVRPVARRTATAGLIGVAAAPLIAALARRSAVDVLVIAVLAALVLFAHRRNIGALLDAARFRPRRPTRKPVSRPVGPNGGPR